MALAAEASLFHSRGSAFPFTALPFNRIFGGFQLDGESNRPPLGTMLDNLT